MACRCTACSYEKYIFLHVLWGLGQSPSFLKIFRHMYDMNLLPGCTKSPNYVDFTPKICPEKKTVAPII